MRKKVKITPPFTVGITKTNYHLVPKVPFGNTITNCLTTLLILLLFSLSGTALAQIDTSKIPGDTTKNFQNRQEEILLENTLEDTEDSKLLDYLDNLKRNPFDLNVVEQQDIETIPFINSLIAKNIIEFRKTNGNFKTKRELLSVEGVSEQLYEIVKAYFVVKKSEVDYTEDESGKVSLESDKSRINLVRNLDLRYRTRFQQDLQTRDGFLNGQYPGSKAKIYNQLNFIYDKARYQLEGNITIEKDAGETSLADFYSGYLELRNYKFVKEAIVGDYSLTFGQGLGMWSSLGFSKGSLTVDPVKKRGYGINAYSSVNESQFFRGAATQLNFNKLDVMLFYSNNFFDASIDTTLNEISSFYFDGYHRTISEQKRSNSAREQLFGGRLFLNKENIRIGLTYWTSKFSKIVGLDSTKQLYSFSGDKANMLSFDYDMIYKNMNFYGEFARSQSGAVAGLSALQMSFSKIANVVFLYRNYPEDFSPVHSFGFGEHNGNTQNESGFYTGLNLTPIRGVVINTYYDQFKFPYRSYFDPVSTSGNDFLSQVNWKIDKSLTLNFKYKNENKEQTTTTQDEFGRDIKKIETRNQMNARFDFDYEVNDRFRVRSRYDYVYVNYSLFGGNNKGNMFFTDIKFVPMVGLTVYSRFIFFQTDSYDSRVYEYEDDIRGVMSNLGLYGKGRRWYIMLRYKPFRFMEITGKYTETYMDGATSIGTGNDQIQGDINNRLNFGMEILF